MIIIISGIKQSCQNDGRMTSCFERGYTSILTYRLEHLEWVKTQAWIKALTREAEKQVTGHRSLAKDQKYKFTWQWRVFLGYMLLSSITRQVVNVSVQVEKVREKNLHSFSYFNPLMLSHPTVQASATGCWTFPERPLCRAISALAHSNVLSICIPVKMTFTIRSSTHITFILSPQIP